MISAKEKLKILYNIINRSGGIENVDLHSELAKSLSAINTMATQDHIAQMQPPPQPSQPVIPPQEQPVQPEPTAQQSPLPNTPPGM
jgi:hypothetical protein